MYNPNGYTKSPLPSPKSPSIVALLNYAPTILSAYTLCYEEDQRLLRTAVQDNEDIVRHIRVLGWMFIFAHNHTMSVDLAKAVTSCKGNKDNYDNLGKFFVDYWIRPFRKHKGRAPCTSGHVSRPSFDTIVELVKHDLVHSPQGYSTAKKLALIRDGFRCLLSGKYDNATVADTKELRETAMRDENFGTGKTECAHIISSSINLEIEKEKKPDYAWAVLQHFEYDEMFQELNGKGIHKLQNVLTLHSDLHDLFDTLQLWLEPTEEGNCYKVQGTQPWVLRTSPKVVKFQNLAPLDSDGTQPDLSLPSKDYLALHAACAKVANLSGAADYLNKLDREYDEGAILAPDGSSVDLVSHALWDALGEMPRSITVG